MILVEVLTPPMRFPMGKNLLDERDHLCGVASPEQWHNLPFLRLVERICV